MVYVGSGKEMDKDVKIRTTETMEKSSFVDSCLLAR
jgi:hypothetical protein